MIPYYKNVLKVINDSVENIPVETYDEILDECVDTVKKGGKIIASGLGKNVPICEKFVGTLNSLGIDARFLHTDTALHGDLGMVGKNDIVFLLSKGGGTSETIQLGQYLKERGTNTWLWTFHENSKAGEVVDKKFVLQLDNEGDEWNIVPNNSTTVYLIILQGMAVEIARRLGVTIKDFGRNHPGGGIGRKLREQGEI